MKNMIQMNTNQTTSTRSKLWKKKSKWKEKKNYPLERKVERDWDYEESDERETRKKYLL